MGRSLIKGAIALAALALCNTIAAETVTEGFDNFKVAYTNGKYEAVMPDGWDYSGAANTFETGDTYKTKKPSIGVQGANTSAYIITPMLEGDFSFYLRNYSKNYQASVKAFACTYNDGDLQLGDQIDEKTLAKSNSPTWEKVTFGATIPTRVALLISRAYFDDFTYTPGQPAGGAVLEISGFPNGSTYNFGGTPVASGTQASFNLINRGTEELNITDISITGDYIVVSGAEPVSIEPGKNVEIIIATPAQDAQGSLKVESNDPASPYIVELSSIWKVPAPEMSVSPETINFGKVASDSSEIITVENTGDALLTVKVESDNEAFTVSASTLEVQPGESEEVTVMFVFEAGTIGLNSANISFVPNEGETFSVTAVAKVADPSVWSEDFDSGELPAGWEADEAGWTFTNGVARGKYVLYNTKYYLTTPSLEVAEADELSFQYKATANYVTVKIEYSLNGADFKEYKSINASKMSEFAEVKITGLEPGAYRFRFINDDYELDNFEGFKLNLNAPRMEVSPIETIDFGKVTATPESKTFTVANTGTGKLTVNITSDSEDFTVQPSMIEDIEPDSPATFTVSFNYDIENLGEKNATITITPTYNEALAVSLSAKAIAKDPNLWEEDFEEGKIPEYWTSNGWAVWKYGLGNGTFVAFAGASTYDTKEDYTLITPRLYATRGQELQFYIGKGTDTTDKLYVQYSHDKEQWEDVEGAPFTDGGNVKTFTAPKDGFYYLKFNGRYGSVDNFIGFRLALKEHDLSLKNADIPVEAHQYGLYTATLTVEEMMGNEEEACATLYVDGEAMAQQTLTVEANGTATFTLSYRPSEAEKEAEVEIIVTYAQGESLTSGKVSKTLVAAPVWDESENDAAMEEGEMPVLVLNYTVKPGWNTITMPFALTDEILETIFGAGYEAFELKEFDGEQIKFQTPLYGYVAGYPYVVYCREDEEEDDEAETVAETEDAEGPSGIILENVKVERTNPQSDISNGMTFNGLYASTTAEGTEHLINEENAGLEQAEAGSKIPGFRAYISLPAGLASVPSLIFLDANGVPTGVNPVIAPENDSTVIFNLQGMPVKEPLDRGIYIINGKKIIK